MYGSDLNPFMVLEYLPGTRCAWYSFFFHLIPIIIKFTIKRISKCGRGARSDCAQSDFTYVSSFTYVNVSN